MSSHTSIKLASFSPKFSQFKREFIVTDSEVEICFFGELVWFKQVLNSRVAKVWSDVFCPEDEAFMYEVETEPALYNFSAKDLFCIFEKIDEPLPRFRLMLTQQEGRSFLTLCLEDETLVNWKAYDLPLNKGPVNKDYDLRHFALEQSLFEEVATVPAKSWQELIDRAYLALDYVPNIVPKIDWQGNSTINFDLRCNSFHYEGINQAQSFWGRVDAELAPTTLVNDLSFRLPTLAIAMTALWGKQDIKIRDNGYLVMLSCGQGTIVATTETIIFRDGTLERRFRGVYEAEIPAKKLRRFADWLPSSPRVKLKMSEEGLLVKSAGKKFVLSDLPGSETREISFQPRLLKDAIAAALEARCPLDPRSQQPVKLILAQYTEHFLVHDPHMLSLVGAGRGVDTLSCCIYHQLQRDEDLPERLDFDLTEFSLALSFVQAFDHECTTLERRDFLVQKLAGTVNLYEHLLSIMAEIFRRCRYYQDAVLDEDPDLHPRRLLLALERIQYQYHDLKTIEAKLDNPKYVEAAQHLMQKIANEVSIVSQFDNHQGWLKQVSLKQA